ncbi:uncharacterized protein TRIADDRAFT_63023 [Trichoplax adhaerens]|uniref:Peptidase S49 domain-containing protein n=1 Tax=Trichoplax adhaerens TaxID=10228 RepID=B3SFN8_TRIAD|nr:hypothetical protein TRIADDRAFT_63023 [Trichoplax adhaerens]EDV18457.1 hypothetical protein TRIADDRAFT_63023 [Trichoplax adhaerens]|eukprot:XP_002119057.1 hypothetical protein TRIADDRAFT_63023 [Trichoplax adhaerens]
MSVLGKNTEEGRKKVQEELDQIHSEFKNLIKLKRPSIDIEKISTGEFWLGSKAKELKLVDEIMTSADYLTSLYQDNKQVYFVKYERKISFLEKLENSIGLSKETVIDVESSRSFLGLSKKTTNEEVIAKIKQYHIDNSISGSDFVKPPFHKVVAISYLDAIVHVNVDGKEEYEIMNIKSGGNIEDKESELVKGFFNYLEKLDARLITFNWTFDKL